MIAYLPVLCAVFVAGVLVGRVGCQVHLAEERAKIALLKEHVIYLYDQIALWKAKWEIEHGALCESQGRHQLILEENGHDQP